MGWLGNVLLLFGAWNLAHKHRWAFLFTIAGGCCWLFEAAKIGRADWVFIESVMLCVALRNFVKWGKNG
jgi:hypothetical protein